MRAIPIEVFDAETHSRPWPATPGDVQDIVDSYNPALRPAEFSLDHDEAVRLPGAVERLERRGSKLVAWCSGLPEFIRGIVGCGLCKGCSIEVFHAANAITPGRPYLKGISFLVTKQPACKGLAPIEAFAECDGFFCYSEATAPRILGGGYLTMDEDPAPVSYVSEEDMIRGEIRRDPNGAIAQAERAMEAAELFRFTEHMLRQNQARMAG